MIAEKKILDIEKNIIKNISLEKHIDNRIYQSNDFIGNDLTAFYYGKKADLKIFNGTPLIKRGKKLDTSI